MEFVKVSTLRDRYIVEEALMDFLRKTNERISNMEWGKEFKPPYMMDDPEKVLQLEEDIREEKKYAMRINFLLNNVVQERD